MRLIKPWFSGTNLVPKEDTKIVKTKYGYTFSVGVKSISFTYYKR